MRRCFVMQPFDGGEFDKRFDDVVSPAIVAAGLEAYRVDRDTAVSIPIDSIESGIRDSDICLADITIDNPNVWFELGYAIACGKDVLLICSTGRTARFPFDVQHRHIIRYSSEAPRDFEALKNSITARLTALLKKERKIDEFAAAGPVAAAEGLSAQEITALAIVMESSLDPDNPPSGHSIKRDMDKAGFTEIAAALGTRGLVQKGLVQVIEASSYNGEDYTGYMVTPVGEEWLLKNQNRLVLRKKDSKPTKFEDFPEDLPF